jgi:hypothetical protein
MTEIGQIRRMRDTRGFWEHSVCMLLPGGRCFARPNVKEGTVVEYPHDGGLTTDGHRREKVSREDLGEEVWAAIVAAWSRR